MIFLFVCFTAGHNGVRHLFRTCNGSESPAQIGEENSNGDTPEQISWEVLPPHSLDRTEPPGAKNIPFDLGRDNPGSLK